MESKIGQNRLTGINPMTTTLSKPRRIHSKEFKQDAVNLAASVEVSRAAADLGISDSILYDWRNANQTEGDDAFRGNGNRTAIDGELARLRCENEVLKMEQNI